MYSLLEKAADETDADELALAERASALDFTQLQFSESFADSTSDENTIWIECSLDTDGLWTVPANTYLDAEMPLIGLAAVSSPDATYGAERPSIQASLTIDPGDQLFYQEGFPAPSTRNEEGESFSPSSRGRSIDSKTVEVYSSAILARYSDSVAESDGNTAVFIAGVLAGLFASLITAGVLGLLEVLISTPVASPAEPAKKRTLVSRLRRFGRR